MSCQLSLTRKLQLQVFYDLKLQYSITGNRGKTKGLTAKQLLYSAALFANLQGILSFSVLSIILAGLLGISCLLEQVQKDMICDWWLSIHFVCFCVSLGSVLVIVQFRAIID